jgi:SAM-dependent methyltransferase
MRWPAWIFRQLWRSSQFEAQTMAAKQREQETLAAELRESVERLTEEMADLGGKLRQRQTEADRFLAELVLRTREAEELRRSAAAKEMATERLRYYVSQLELGVVKIALVTPVPSCLSCDCQDCSKRPECGGDRGSHTSSTRVCRSADIVAVRQTIESVLAQKYPRLEFIVAPVGAPGSETAPSWIEPYESRAIRMAGVSAGPFEAIARALESSDAEVVGWLEPGDVLEPGALQNVGAFFRDHPRSVGAVFDDTVDVGQWRLTRPRPRLDVLTLLSERDSGKWQCASIFVRRKAYRAIGRIRTTQGRATGWDFLLRFSRRYGFDRPGTHVACRRPQPAGSLLLPLHLWQSAGQPHAEALASWRRDLEATRSGFESTYGTAGRLRGRLIHQSLRLRDLLRRLLGGERLVFPTHSMGYQAATVAPATVAANQQRDPEEVGVSPLTRRHPVRLIFSGPGGVGGQLCPIYYDPNANLAYTPVGPAPQYPEQPSTWPFAKHRAIHVWERHLVNIPCPRLRLPSTSEARTQSVQLLSVLTRFARPQNGDVSFLHAGCGDGQLLGQLRQAVRWSLAGTESRPQPAAAARAGGFEVWDADPFDAAGRLPIGQSFDVIFLDERTPRAGDLVTTLLRLRQLLKPGGHIVLSGVNLDSRLLDLFGPTWPGWQIDRPLAVPGRRGVSQLACLADLRLTRFRTFTEVSACVTAVQQNRLRRVASPPPDPPTQEDRRRGTRLTAWANLLWDWRCKGDTFYALLE